MNSATPPPVRGVLSLIDGQQRMTTILLLLKALLQHVELVDSRNHLVTRINSLLMYQGAFTGRQRSILVNKNPDFHECFESIVLT
jgi:uncharacterized protein with ParB-like and HNH nuclease domain